MRIDEMLKSFYLAVMVIPIATEVTLSQALRAQSLYPPEVSSSVADTLVCYMQTADGRLLQLESLCQGEFSTDMDSPTSSSSVNQTFGNDSSSQSSGNFSRLNNQANRPEVNGPEQNDAAAGGPAETALCEPANAPECRGIDFSSAAPDFTPDTSPVPISQ
jgi:hypothetical protein